MMFEEKIALVTGGGSGIGRASALAMAAEGASVMLGDIDEAGGKETVGLLQDAGGKATFLHTDVTSETAVEALVGAAVSTYGRLDIAFNSAGIVAPHSSVQDQDMATLDHTLDVVFRGIYHAMKYEISAMLESGGGAIVNASSTWGLNAYPNRSGYIAGKHAVCGLTKTAALELATKGIRVNAVAPGPIRTPMLLTDWKGDVDLAASGVPMGRVGEAEEVADAVVWLCSNKSSYITGHILPIDGGMLCQVG